MKKDGPTLIELSREWQHAVGRSDLDRGEKAVMNALLPFIDVRTGGNCYPSETLIGRYAGMSADGVSRILDRLEMKGVLRFLRRGGGRRVTHHMELDLAALKSRESKPAGNSDRGSGFPERENSDQGAPKPRSPSRRAPSAETGNTDRRSEEPSIHTPPDRPIIGPTGANAAVAVGGGWMDGRTHDQPDVRTALQQLRIRGPNLDRLARAPGISVALIGEEARPIDSDPTVVNKPAVLARALANRLGITFKGGPRLAFDDMAALSRIAARRESLNRNRE